MSNTNSITSICENCWLRPRFQERTLARRIDHPFCGLTCKNEYARRRAAHIQQRGQSISSLNSLNGSNLPSADTRSGLLKKLDATSPATLRVFEQFKGKWDGDQRDRVSVQTIYRINQQEEYTGRFDDAIIMNDEPWQTAACYYGGQILCDSITNCDENADPCRLNDCYICLAIRFAFEQSTVDNTLSEGIYGSGLYTSLNPANSHPCTTAKPDSPCRVILQCRVILDSLSESETSRPFSAITDATGQVFCQKEAIIPTHLIVYLIKPAGDANGSHTQPTRAGTQNGG